MIFRLYVKHNLLLALSRMFLESNASKKKKNFPVTKHPAMLFKQTLMQIWCSIESLLMLSCERILTEMETSSHLHIRCAKKQDIVCR
jgi:hypothetical protein